MKRVITQYMRPNGNKVSVEADISKKHFDMAKDMILSCEVLTTGVIAIYARYNYQPVEKEILLLANNVIGGLSSPNAVLEKCIEKALKKLGLGDE